MEENSFFNWKNGEFSYCHYLIWRHGDNSVGSDPKTIATYLRLQASSAFRDKEYEISARLSTAATCINEDARNDHEPRWDEALDCLLCTFAPGADNRCSPAAGCKTDGS